MTYNTDARVMVNSHMSIIQTSVSGMRMSKTLTPWRRVHIGRSRTLGERAGVTMDSPTSSTSCQENTTPSQKEHAKCSDGLKSMSRLSTSEVQILRNRITQKYMSANLSKTFYVKL